MGRKQSVNTLNKNIYSSIFCKCLASLILLFLRILYWTYEDYSQEILVEMPQSSIFQYLQLKLDSKEKHKLYENNNSH